MGTIAILSKSASKYILFKYIYKAYGAKFVFSLIKLKSFSLFQTVENCPEINTKAQSTISDKIHKLETKMSSSYTVNKVILSIVYKLCCSLIIIL